MILDEPGQATLLTTSSRVNVKTTLQFICSLNDDNKGKPDTYKWQLIADEGDVVVDWQESEIFDIYIDDVRQGGLYRCTAQNNPYDDQWIGGLPSEPVHLDVFGMFKNA